MVDTIRSRAALIALLPDNTSGEISPQDIRDFLVSVHGVYGGIQVDGGVAAQSFNTTPAKVTGFTANMAASAGVTPDHTNDQITVGTDGVYNIRFSGSGNGINATAYIFQLRLNGNAQIFKGRVTGVTGSQVCVSFGALLTCAANDILTVYGESDSGGGQNFTFTEMQFFVHRIA